MEPSIDRPAEVQATLALGLDVDLLDLVLADVADPEVAGLAVEAGPPRIPQAVAPDLLAAAALGERIALGDRIRTALVDVDAQDVAEQVVLVLAIAERVAGRVATTVAERDVQVAIGPEAQPATVVVPLRPGEVEAVSGRNPAATSWPALRCLYSTTRVLPAGVL